MPLVVAIVDIVPALTGHCDLFQGGEGGRVEDVLPAHLREARRAEQPDHQRRVPDRLRGGPETRVEGDCQQGGLRGNHLSNTTCLTHVLFKSGEHCSELR